MCLLQITTELRGCRRKCPDLGILVYMLFCFGVLVACAYFALDAHKGAGGMVIISLGAMLTIGCVICQLEERRSQNERRFGVVAGIYSESAQSPPPLYESPPPSYRSASVDLTEVGNETNPLLSN